MESILTLNGSFLDNICKIFGRWGTLLRKYLWMFHPTLLTGSLVNYWGVRDRGLPPNWLCDLGGYLASSALGFSPCRVRGSSWSLLQSLPASWLQMAISVVLSHILCSLILFWWSQAKWREISGGIQDELCYLASLGFLFLLFSVLFSNLVGPTWLSHCFGDRSFFPPQGSNMECGQLSSCWQIVKN